MCCISLRAWCPGLMREQRPGHANTKIKRCSLTAPSQKSIPGLIVPLLQHPHPSELSNPDRGKRCKRQGSIQAVPASPRVTIQKTTNELFLAAHGYSVALSRLPWHHTHLFYAMCGGGRGLAMVFSPLVFCRASAVSADLSAHPRNGPPATSL